MKRRRFGKTVASIAAVAVAGCTSSDEDKSNQATEEQTKEPTETKTPEPATGEVEIVKPATEVFEVADHELYTEQYDVTGVRGTIRNKRDQRFTAILKVEFFDSEGTRIYDMEGSAEDVPVEGKSKFKVETLQEIDGEIDSYTITVRMPKY